jgi:hypothetical protein
MKFILIVKIKLYHPVRKSSRAVSKSRGRKSRREPRPTYMKSSSDMHDASN